MKIVLGLGIAPVTVMNAKVIRENYPQLWNDFILPRGVEELTNLMDTGELQLSEPELASPGGLPLNRQRRGKAAAPLP